MKRLLFFVGVCALWLFGCTTTDQAPLPTALPTAIPPEAEAEVGAWSVAFTYEFSPEPFAPGVHRYQLFSHCPVILAQDYNSEWIYFEVSEDAPVLENPVYLRLSGLSSGLLTPDILSEIHPNQMIIAAITYVGLQENAAKLISSGCEALVRWDDKSPQVLVGEKPFRP